MITQIDFDIYFKYVCFSMFEGLSEDMKRVGQIIGVEER